MGPFGLALKRRRADERQQRGGPDAKPPEGFEILTVPLENGEECYQIQWDDADPRDLRAKAVHDDWAMAVECAWEIRENKSEPQTRPPPLPPWLDGLLPEAVDG